MPNMSISTRDINMQRNYFSSLKNKILSSTCNCLKLLSDIFNFHPAKNLSLSWKVPTNKHDAECGLTTQSSPSLSLYPFTVFSSFRFQCCWTSTIQLANEVQKRRCDWRQSETPRTQKQQQEGRAHFTLLPHSKFLYYSTLVSMVLINFELNFIYHKKYCNQLEIIKRCNYVK